MKLKRMLKRIWYEYKYLYFKPKERPPFKEGA